LFFQANEQSATTHDREVVVEEKNFARRFWNNATFSFLLDKFEKRNWDFNMNLMKKQNWKDFATIVNIHFPSDVQHTWRQCRDIQQNERQVQCGEETNQCHKCSTFKLAMVSKILLFNCWYY
jgi:hypothetical protein